MAHTKKIVLVTGGSRGLGKDMVLSLAKKGLAVILTYNSKEEEAQEVVEQVKALGEQAAALQLTVGELQQLDGFYQQLAHILQEQFQRKDFDYLVNNAGIGIYAPFADTTEEQFDSLMQVHFKGAFFLTQKLLPLLANGGGIVNISTGLARFTTPGYAAYASMKGAIETLTKYQAKELGARGIRANVVAPGPIETDFGGGVVRDNADINAGLASQTALGRVGLPDDIGGVVAFLCTDDARWVNAQRIEVSGGTFL